jgi:Uma2 family endonuclease
VTFSTRWTIADLEKLPEMNDGTRYEIIDGELFVSRAPNFHHEHACVQLVTALSNWSKQSGLGVVNGPTGLIFAADEAVIPDVFWISWPRLRAHLSPTDKKLHGPPELVVEVLSPGADNERRDRVAKLGVYSRRGVDEYWIVDLERRSVEVYRRVAAGLEQTALFGADDSLGSPLLPGFALAIAELFFPEQF